MLTEPYTRAHENSHAEYSPTEPIPTDIIDDISNQGYLPEDIRDYLFSDPNGTESSARMSQLKNAFGLTSDEPLTMEMLDYMIKNYVDLFPDFNNYMEEWLYSISRLAPKNKRKLLEWLNTHSLGIGGTVVGGAAIGQTTNQK